jgi:cytoplasmic iron level regulating protein YaaA (DUF328/UPF0246 family)
MKKVVLIACSSKKERFACRAESMYQSTLYKLSLAYAKQMKADKIFILSAKYGLLELSQIIEPYNITLNKMSNSEIQNWSNKVYESLKEKVEIDNSTFVFLAGNNYRKGLAKSLKSIKVPLEGLRIGEQMHFLKNNI